MAGARGGFLDWGLCKCFMKSNLQIRLLASVLVHSTVPLLVFLLVCGGIATGWSHPGYQYPSSRLSVAEGVTAAVLGD